MHSAETAKPLNYNYVKSGQIPYHLWPVKLAFTKSYNSKMGMEQLLYINNIMLLPGTPGTTTTGARSGLVWNSESD